MADIVVMITVLMLGLVQYLIIQNLFKEGSRLGTHVHLVLMICWFGCHKAVLL